MDRIRWKVVKIVKQTKDVYSFVLKNETGGTIHYHAGQFLTFIFNSKIGEIRRSYSISSAPKIDEMVTITVKRIPNGEISRHLTNHVRANDILTSIYPAGRFTIETNPTLQRRFFFIAAGSGIVPVFSLIKKILNEEPLSSILLVCQNHNESSIIFKKQLEEIGEKFLDKFKWINFLSKPQSKLHSPHKLNNFLLENWLMNILIRRKKKNFTSAGQLRLCAWHSSH
jgi:ring-1,2-phenylacetyl-CoA epoxidase subunit PaaE